LSVDGGESEPWHSANIGFARTSFVLVALKTVTERVLCTPGGPLRSRELGGSSLGNRCDVSIDRNDGSLLISVTDLLSALSE
jgi:hypothetical protein